MAAPSSARASGRRRGGFSFILRELEQPAKTMGQWAAANAAELALLKEKSPETDSPTIYELLQRHLDRCNELKLTAETATALLSVVEMTSYDQEPEQLISGLGWAVRWIIKHQRWDVLEPLEDKYEAEFRKSRRLLYYLAAAAKRAGRDDRATGLAERAFSLKADDEDDRVTTAKAVAELGFVEWAEREYRRTIDAAPVISQTSMEARSDLAMWMHDRQDFKAAADLLSEFCDALDADRAAKQQLMEEVDRTNGSGSETLREIAARREYLSGMRR